MNFPLGYSQKFNIKNANHSQLINRIERIIEQAGPKNLEKSENKLIFKGGLARFKTFTGLGWNILSLITKGNFEIIKVNQKEYFKYRISFIEYFTITVLINFLIPTIQDDIKLILISTIALWVFVYLGNCFLTIWRLNFRINRIITDLNREHSDSFISEEQKTWIQNEKLCPACGYNINSSDIECSDCGLTVRQIDHA